MMNCNELFCIPHLMKNATIWIGKSKTLYYIENIRNEDHVVLLFKMCTVRVYCLFSFFLYVWKNAQVVFNE